MNNFSQNNFSNDDNFNDLSQQTVTQAAVMCTPVTYNNNFDQQPMPSVALNNVTNYQQYDTSSNIPHHNYQQFTNSIPNNHDTIFNHQQYSNASNNNPQNDHQQFDSQHNDQNPLNSLQSNISPLLNSLGININSPQATIIIMPAINSDIQNLLQQIHTFLINSTSRLNS